MNSIHLPQVHRLVMTTAHVWLTLLPLLPPTQCQRPRAGVYPFAVQATSHCGICGQAGAWQAFSLVRINLIRVVCDYASQLSPFVRCALTPQRTAPVLRDGPNGEGRPVAINYGRNQDFRSHPICTLAFRFLRLSARGSRGASLMVTVSLLPCFDVRSSVFGLLPGENPRTHNKSH